MTAKTKFARARRLASVLGLGFSSGLPLAITGSTLQAWMSDEKVNLALIGLFSLVGLPYSFKFLWSPLMDRFRAPFLGRRRGWILLMQIALMFAIFVMSLIRPAAAPHFMAVAAFIVAFLSASQDIVIDAWRTETLPSTELGIGASFNMMGYRLAMLASGAVAMAIADHLPWPRVYQLLSLSILIGVIATWVAPESNGQLGAPKTLRDAVILPLREFLKRRGAAEVLAFIVLYKLDTVIASALLTPFLLDLGFSKTEISVVYKGFGFFATIGGTLLGGALMLRWSMKRALWTFGILQGISGACFVILAYVGKDSALMALAIFAENFLSGMGTAAFSAFLMSLCDKRYTATQYALLSSVMSLTRVVGGAPTGWLAQSVGWPVYFVISIWAMVPGLFLLSRFDRWAGRPEIR